VKDTQAKLWFDTPQEEKDYDDMMMANIELKTSEYESPNYTVLFLRETTESMPTMSEKQRADQDRFENIIRPDPDTKWRRYGQKFSDHSNWRTWSLEVGRSAGWIAAYFALRDLPVRNFYARSLIMSLFAANFLHNFGVPFLPITFYQPQQISLRHDEFLKRRVQNYEMADETANYYHAPGSRASYSVQDLIWRGSQPGHLDLTKVPTLHNLGHSLRAPRTVTWDGTFNMPTMGLADTKHKYATSVKFA